MTSRSKLDEAQSQTEFHQIEGSDKPAGRDRAEKQQLERERQRKQLDRERKHKERDRHRQRKELDRDLREKKLDRDRQRKQDKRHKHFKQRDRTITRARSAPRRTLLQSRSWLARWRRSRVRRRAAAMAPRAWDRELRKLAQSELPIVVGPWTNEVGYEVLYWIPLLRGAFAKAGIDPGRVVAVSRGGVASWYESVATRYVDIYDLIEPAQLVAASERRIAEQGGQRQLRETYEDVQLAREAARRCELGDHMSLHPVALYSLLTGYLRGLRPGKEILARCDHSPFPANYTRPDGLPFAGDYVVCKFYANPSFPRTAENERFVDRMLRRLAERMPVVMLNTGLTLDDHREFSVPDVEGVFDASGLLSAADNLAVQSALTACSRGFVGTYGGFSYLAPLLGVPGLGIFSSSEFVPVHMGSAGRVFADAEAGYSAVHTSALEVI